MHTEYSEIHFPKKRHNFPITTNEFLRYEEDIVLLVSGQKGHQSRLDTFADNSKGAHLRFNIQET